MQQDLLDRVIFSPAKLALDLASGLQQQNVEVTLFTPGPVNTPTRNVVADLSLFEAELARRSDTYLDLLKKHPVTFVTLARQVQAELLATAYQMANNDVIDIVHVYTNEEELALPFAHLCAKPVVFTHHDPFNFLIRYKSVFPKYSHLNWVSMSYAQRLDMPSSTNWVANIYHGLGKNRLHLQHDPAGNYIAYLGRIIEPKGLHLAIAAVKLYNALNPDKPYALKIAGKHYAGHKDSYWHEQIEPELDEHIEYVGFIKTDAQKQAFLGNATALLVPSIFNEPFGMVMIEALACGTPVIGLESGAIPEVVRNNETGFVVSKTNRTVDDLAGAIHNVRTINRTACRQEFEARFTVDRMCQEHAALYKKLTTS